MKDNNVPDGLLDQIVHFIQGIGLKLTFASRRTGTFLQGIHMDKGVIVVDKDQE